MYQLSEAGEQVIKGIDTKHRHYAKIKLQLSAATLSIAKKEINYKLFSALLNEAMQKYSSYVDEYNIITAVSDAWKYASGLSFVPKENYVDQINSKNLQILEKMVIFYANETKDIFSVSSKSKIFDFKINFSRILAEQYKKAKNYDCSKYKKINETISIFSKDNFPVDVLRRSLIESGIDKFGIIPETSRDYHDYKL